MAIINSNIDEIIAGIQAMEVDSEETVLILIGEKNPPNISELIAKIKNLNIKFIGGIFPGIIYGNKSYFTGTLLVKLPLASPIYTITGLENTEINLPKIEKTIGTRSKPTALVLVDGLASNNALFLSELHNTLGNKVNFIGGGAGSISLEQKPCIFNDTGFLKNAAIICLLDYKLDLGVRHGWKKLAGPIVATRTEKNAVYELNWNNAFEVYKKVVNSDSELPIEKDDLFTVAKAYPFGMSKEGTEDIVRAPFSIGDENSLICLGEVPENSVLYILRYESQSLINSAKQATLDGLNNVKSKVEQVFVVDCICRTLLLNDDFNKELEAISEEITKTVPFGILSLGEISSYGQDLLEFFNLTTVVGILSD